MYTTIGHEAEACQRLSIPREEVPMRRGRRTKRRCDMNATARTTKGPEGAARAGLCLGLAPIQRAGGGSPPGSKQAPSTYMLDIEFSAASHLRV
jgi:hypothetical protein